MRNVTHTNTMKLAPVVKTWIIILVSHTKNAFKNVRKAQTVLESSTSSTMVQKTVSDGGNARPRPDPTLKAVILNVGT